MTSQICSVIYVYFMWLCLFSFSRKLNKIRQLNRVNRSEITSLYENFHLKYVRTSCTTIQSGEIHCSKHSKHEMYTTIKFLNVENRLAKDSCISSIQFRITMRNKPSTIMFHPDQIQIYNLHIYYFPCVSSMRIAFEISTILNEWMNERAIFLLIVENQMRWSVDICSLV